MNGGGIATRRPHQVGQPPVWSRPKGNTAADVDTSLFTTPKPEPAGITPHSRISRQMCKILPNYYFQKIAMFAVPTASGLIGSNEIINFRNN